MTEVIYSSSDDVDIACTLCGEIVSAKDWCIIYAGVPGGHGGCAVISCKKCVPNALLASSLVDAYEDTYSSMGFIEYMKMALK